MLYPVVNQNVDWFTYNQQQQQHYGHDTTRGYNKINSVNNLPKTSDMLMVYPPFVNSDYGGGGGGFNQNVQSVVPPFIGSHGYGGGICNMNVQSPAMGFSGMVNNVAGFVGENIPSPFPPPCQGPQPWSYAQCYGFYGDAPCQYVDIIDMEDFM